MLIGVRWFVCVCGQLVEERCHFYTNTSCLHTTACTQSVFTWWTKETRHDGHLFLIHNSITDHSIQVQKQAYNQIRSFGCRFGSDLWLSFFLSFLFHKVRGIDILRKNRSNVNNNDDDDDRIYNEYIILVSSLSSFPKSYTRSSHIQLCLIWYQSFTPFTNFIMKAD